MSQSSITCEIVTVQPDEDSTQQSHADMTPSIALELAKEFNHTMGISMPTRPSPGRLAQPLFARKLESMPESEVAELDKHIHRAELSETFRELADVIYVTYGLGLELGIDIDEYLIEAQSDLAGSLTALKTLLREELLEYKNSVEHHSYADRAVEDEEAKLALHLIAKHDIVRVLFSPRLADLKREVAKRHFSGVARELAKMSFCAVWIGKILGVDLERQLRLVHEANLTRRSSSGEIRRREDGKVLKGSEYQPPKNLL